MQVPEFVMWFETNNKLYGRARNPYDLSRITGGSSGGEGALLASAGSLLGIGSDVGGSIRIPAMFNGERDKLLNMIQLISYFLFLRFRIAGIFGHKTTQQYVPVDGMFPGKFELLYFKIITAITTKTLFSLPHK